MLAGIADIMGEMRPGLTLSFSFGSSGAQGYVTVNGSLLTYTTPYGVVAAFSSMRCSPIELLPGVRYAAQMEDGFVVILVLG